MVLVLVSAPRALSSSPGRDGGREDQGVEEWGELRSAGMAYLTGELGRLVTVGDTHTRTCYAGAMRTDDPRAQDDSSAPYAWSLPSVYLPKPDAAQALDGAWPAAPGYRLEAFRRELQGQAALGSVSVCLCICLCFPRDP